MKLNDILLRINTVVRDKNLNPHSIGIDLKMNRGTVRNYLNGKTPITIGFLDTFCTFYDIKMTEIIFSNERSTNTYKQLDEKTEVNEPPGDGLEFNINQQNQLEQMKMIQQLLKDLTGQIVELRLENEKLREKLSQKNNGLNQSA